MAKSIHIVKVSDGSPWITYNHRKRRDYHKSKKGDSSEPKDTRHEEIGEGNSAVAVVPTEGI